MKSSPVHFYQDMCTMREELDLATYPKSSPYYNSSNNKVVRKFNDDASGSPIIEIVGLKPKMYSYQTLTDPSPGEATFTNMKWATGLHRAGVAQLRHDQYKAQIDNPEERYVPNRRLGSKQHQIYGIEGWIRLSTNIALSL